MTNKNTWEILTICHTPLPGDDKIITWQYDKDSPVYERMLARFRKWESEGKLEIVDIRPAQYHI